MGTYDDGYRQALLDMQAEVREMVQDPSTSSEGRLELLGLLSFVSDQIDAKKAGHRDHRTEGPAGATELGM